MSFRNQLKNFRRGLARHSMFATIALIKRAPYCVVKGIMLSFLSVAFLFTIKLKRVAKESLDIAFGQEKTSQEKKKILKDCFYHFGRGMIEMMYFMNHPHLIKENIIIENRERLDEALRQGRGVVAVTGHFGNFPLMMLKLALEGYKVHVIMRRTRDSEIDEVLYDYRSRLGVGTIYTHPRKECVLESLKALRNNEIVFILLDQHFGSDGAVMVDFFGQKAATAPGAVVFAERAKCPIVPIFIRREKGDQSRIMIEPIFELQNYEDHQAMVQKNVERLTAIIEKYIRQYPQEWGWMHKRWKDKQS
ncbi:MAG: lysophospholipid acyltransferase family protein [Candidatus Omnitrophica bacterium]|nr:lysophospholipid acyltransferase family protein [Candidatus Omnitrophota bacterium]